MKWLAVLRLVAVLHATALFVQPIAIGIYLNGSPTGLRVHEPVGLAIGSIGVAQLLVAIGYWRSSGRRLAPIAALLILSAESVQIAMGYNKQLPIHIPLGIALIGSAVGFAAWTYRSAAKA
ncbi:hypothetical protein HPO96_18255 [Kribbella sandramycini]|uniref:DoxX-like protein n=1 Tax=Kribbella sandramycini TaxID=60450 RepID=A0A7Y4L2C2_9ACTN|nr:hypothetical protein [Kribbella sandramycini]MBB6564487.1 hypothetical protein [Kribbella sandramycini]NOL42191.1 hypothetical protein [Kribbella sandramycini]